MVNGVFCTGQRWIKFKICQPVHICIGDKTNFDFQSVNLGVQEKQCTESWHNPTTVTLDGSNLQQRAFWFSAAVGSIRNSLVLQEFTQRQEEMRVYQRVLCAIGAASGILILRKTCSLVKHGTKQRAKMTLYSLSSLVSLSLLAAVLGGYVKFPGSRTELQHTLIAVWGFLSAYSLTKVELRYLDTSKKAVLITGKISFFLHCFLQQQTSWLQCLCDKHFQPCNLAELGLLAFFMCLRTKYYLTDGIPRSWLWFLVFLFRLWFRIRKCVGQTSVVHGTQGLRLLPGRQQWRRKAAARPVTEHWSSAAGHHQRPERAENRAHDRTAQGRGCVRRKREGKRILICVASVSFVTRRIPGGMLFVQNRAKTGQNETMFILFPPQESRLTHDQNHCSCATRLLSSFSSGALWTTLEWTTWGKWSWCRLT